MDPNEQPPPPEAPDKEAMDKIRQRRVAKLGGPSSTPKSADETVPSPSTAPDAEESTAEASAPKPEPAAEERRKITITKATRPVSSLDSEQALKALGTAASASSSPPTETTSRKRDAAEAAIDTVTTAPPPAARRPQATSSSRDEPFDVFADKWLSSIFRVTVRPDQPADAHGHKLVLLESLSEELAGAGEPLRLSANCLDPALLEACTKYTHAKPLLDYLLPCWKRVIRALKGIKNLVPEKEELLREAKRMCMSSCIFAITVPELYGREQGIAASDSLVQYLLRDHENESGICLDFVTEAVSRFDDDDTVVEIFTSAMREISQKLSTMNMDDDYKPYINALLTYVKFPKLITAIAKDETFLTEQAPQLVEKNTLLGPFFRISPLQADVARNYFASPRTMDQGRIKSNQDALRMTLDAHQDDLFHVADVFVRSGADNRNRLLDWFAFAMNVNHKRRAMQVDPREVASDGFMINVTVILDRLCVPFMDNSFGKVDRIDIDYLRRKPRIDISDETKLNADQAASDEFYSHEAEGNSNFISDVFFLTLAAHHYGTEAANNKLKNLEKDIKYYERQIAQMETERPKFVNRPDQLALFDESLKRHTDVLERSMSLKLAIEGVLMDEKKMQRDSLLFMRYVAVWLLRVASGSNYIPGKTKLVLPLPEQVPASFACLPEYALQDIVDNFKFVFRYIPQMMPNAVGEEMIALCITFLTSSEYVKNPYLKASLVTLLFCGTWPLFHYKKGVLGDALTNTTFANEHLLHALMKFYIECESTGAHTQFYDKFNIRYEIFQVIKCVWDNDVYKRQLTRESKVNRAFFVRFVNMLLNDATYVLDEALTKFPKIHDLQRELRESPNMPQEEREKKAQELQTNEGQAQSYMQLANETMAMMKLFTKALSDAFTMPEIVTRLAGMLDYNLETLTGPKSSNLRVDNPEKYHFRPKTLLGDFVDIYLNLGGSAAFVEAVATDGRSYKPEILDRATHILESRSLKNAEELAAWNELKKRFRAAKEAADQAELDLGEIPADFEDPILGDLMRDPVILPSNNIVDRSTIIQHLLSDPKDPFTRKPMTIDDVVPDDDLRKRIEQWREERISSARIAAATASAQDTALGPAPAPDAMDTAEG